MENIKNITEDVIIVTFSGRQQGLTNLTIFEFTNFLEDTFPNYDKLFCRDEKVLWYNYGLTDITSNIDETITFLFNKTYKYSKVIFIVASMGGYCAMIIGSILNVDCIIAFRPQTFINNCIDNYDKKYKDVIPYINKTTKYFIYGDSAIIDPVDIHSIIHCRRLPKLSNIINIEIVNFDLREYKNNGKLTEDFKYIFINI
jgi:hypothetical protein